MSGEEDEAETRKGRELHALTSGGECAQLGVQGGQRNRIGHVLSGVIEGRAGELQAGDPAAFDGVERESESPRRSEDDNVRGVHLEGELRERGG